MLSSLRNYLFWVRLLEKCYGEEQASNTCTYNILNYASKSVQ